LVGQTPNVVNQNGELSKAVAVFPTGTKPVYRLLTKAGYSIKLTADHKVDTLNRGDIAACELTQNDIVKLQGANFGTKSIHPTIAYLAGLALGDGCVVSYKTQKQAVWTFGSQEIDQATKVANLINEYKKQ
jgi:ribonucleoside-diphosphate reductase alpha chain